MPASPTALRDAYQAQIAADGLKPDPAQAGAVRVLQNFADDLEDYPARAEKETNRFIAKLDRFLFGGARRMRPFVDSNGKAGLYIFGKVGRGKSMLMNLFMDHVAIPKKRRVHFHQFMLEIHARLNQLRLEDDIDDIMKRLVRAIASETSLLCFDEFHVSNIADAMILGRLFEELFKAGVAIVATSNWAPDDLYQNGLQRDRFLPFIELIKEKMFVFEMNGRTDYRYEQLRNMKSYFCPLGLEMTRKLQGIFLELTRDAKPDPVTLLVNGRELRLARTAHGVGFFNFDELCREALGPADYLAIAACLNTVILDGVPGFKPEQRNEAVRFMTMIDALYEARVKFFMASAVPIERLAPSSDLGEPFQRTISRLMEMQGKIYRAQPHLQGEKSA